MLSFNELYIKHKDWEGICYIENDRIYRKNIIDEYGTYIINKNISLLIKWEKWPEETFSYDNILKIYTLNKNNINIIKPKNIFIDNNLFISNISLCKKNIIISLSPHISDNNINISINTNYTKEIYKNNDYYEPSFTIILKLENYIENISININDNEIYLEQMNILEHTISAMTLFKDDYNLLKRYIKYYSNLDVNIFFIYYNAELNDNIINNIKKLNTNNTCIYLIEWNYLYWWKPKQHNAQTIAMNDSLHILKNYGNYTLYNDLDEYIILEKYNNFNELINDKVNEYIDIFVFKNRFCKMGNGLISYQNFDDMFDLTQIIKGNYWDKYREKNLIKLQNINVLGIHKIFNEFNDININSKVISEFYHIINFEEKYREELMTEYLT